MPDYSKGKIYKIVSNQTEKIYIGSTCQPLCERIAGHRSKHKMFKAGNHHYISSFDMLKYDDAKIILISNVECKNKEELLREERKCIESSNNCVNKNLPFRKTKEYKRQYREQNKDKIKEKNKLFYENNKEQILQKERKRYEENKEIILDKRKEYRCMNKEVIKQRKKEYAEKNKEKIKEHRSQIYNCDCGSSFQINKKSRHLKSLKHQHYIKQMEIIESL